MIKILFDWIKRLIGWKKEEEEDVVIDDLSNFPSRDIGPKCKRCKGSIVKKEMIKINENYNFEASERWCIVDNEVVDENHLCKHFKRDKNKE